jgi:transcriptional regulator with XRE-family HTH domain
VEHEQRNGSTPLDGFVSENGRANGNGHGASPDRLASGGQAAVNGHANTNGRSSSYARERELEYAARSLRSSSLAGEPEQQASNPQAADSKRAQAPARPRKTEALQQVGEARRRQGLSIRCIAQRLGLSVNEVRAQEEADADMTLSELYRWQSVLDVPLEELLADPQDALSPRVLMRARMLRVMKTAQALRAQARSESERRLARLLIDQLIEIMPELKEVAAWPTVGHRRTADEVGRIGERPISDDFMHEAS